jgi:hypothetical protein
MKSNDSDKMVEFFEEYKTLKSPQGLSEFYEKLSKSKSKSLDNLNFNLISSFESKDKNNFIFSIKSKSVDDYQMESKDIVNATIRDFDSAVDLVKQLKTFLIALEQEMIISEPPVYVAKTTDKKTEKVYFTAKTFWPLINGKKKEVKIYLGKAEDFGNDTMSPVAKENAVKKMRETLRNRRDLGEI